MSLTLPQLSPQASDVELLLQKGEELGKKLSNHKKYQALVQRATQAIAIFSDPNNWDIRSKGPFKSDEDSPEIDAYARRFAEKFLFTEKAEDANSVYDVIDSTFNPLSGAFANIKEILANDPNPYAKSKRALEIIEAELKKIFVKNKSEEPDGEQNRGPIKASVWALRLQLLTILFSSDSESIVVEIRRLLAKASGENKLLSTGSSQPLALMEEMVPNEQAVTFYTALVEDKITKADRKKLQALYADLKELQPLWQAFRYILAEEIMNDLQKDSSSQKAHLLLPLVTAEGLYTALALGKTDDNRTVKTLFGALDIFEKYCSDVVRVQDFNEKGENISRPRGTFFLQTLWHGFRPSCVKDSTTKEVFIKFGTSFLHAPINKISLRPAIYITWPSSLPFRTETYWDPTCVEASQYVYKTFNEGCDFWYQKKDGNIRYLMIKPPRYYSSGAQVDITKTKDYFKGSCDDWFVVEVSPYDHQVFVKIGSSYYEVRKSAISTPQDLL